MSLKIGTIIRLEGVLLLVLSASMAAPFLIALIEKETDCIGAFLGVILVCVSVGLIIWRYFNLSHYKLKGRDGFLVVSLSWFVASLAGALPFWLSGCVPNFFDAFFESCSGFTTTGSSILTDIEIMPRSILFWRSFTHWLGGMGIIVFITALLPAFGITGQIAAHAETTGPTKDKITAKFSDGSKSMYKIYLILTAVETVFLKLGGLSWFDALIHTFGSVGTGGLSSYNDSIGHFNSIYAEIVIAVFMLLSATNFNLYFMARKRGISQLIHDAEFRFYLTIILIAGGLITLYNGIFDRFANIGETLVNAFFQVISIITTTGYMTDDYNLWPTFSRMIIFCLFFVGGCSGSTGGGVKCARLLIGLKMIRRSISLKLHPSRITPITLNGKELSNSTSIKVSNFMFTYMFMVVVGTLLLSLNGFDFMTNFSAAASCLGNIGPGFNLVGPSMNYAMFSNFSKAICSFLMVVGRLELYTVLVLFSKFYWNPDKVK